MKNKRQHVLCRLQVSSVDVIRASIEGMSKLAVSLRHFSRRGKKREKTYRFTQESLRCD